MSSLREVGRGDPWMTETEKRLTRKFMRGIRSLFEANGVADTPLLALRVNDVLVNYVLVRRLETGLCPDPAAEGDERAAAAVVEAVSRARERMRKAMKELEEACAKAGTPIDKGLADKVKPMMKVTADLAARAVADSADTRPSGD